MRPKCAAFVNHQENRVVSKRERKARAAFLDRWTVEDALPGTSRTGCGRQREGTDHRRPWHFRLREACVMVGNRQESRVGLARTEGESMVVAALESARGEPSVLAACTSILVPLSSGGGRPMPDLARIVLGSRTNEPAWK